MKKEAINNKAPGQEEHSLHKVSLPCFINDEHFGLGDVVKGATSYVGIKPCGRL